MEPTETKEELVTRLKEWICQTCYSSPPTVSVTLDYRYMLEELIALHETELTTQYQQGWRDAIITLIKGTQKLVPRAALMDEWLDLALQLITDVPTKHPDVKPLTKVA